MRITANKPCNFGGRKFLIGEEIPVELVANPKAQEKMGVISIADGGEVPPEAIETMTAQVGVVKFEIPIHTESEDIVLVVTNGELTVFTDIRQIGVQATEDKQKISEMIQKVESEDLLILLDALDGRKHVKEEAQARVQALQDLAAANPPEDDGTTPPANDAANPPEDDGETNPDGQQPGGDD